MSKMGQYVIELTEKGLPSIMDIQIETDVPLPKQNQPLPNLPLDDLLMGQSFFLATRGRTQTRGENGSRLCGRRSPASNGDTRIKRSSVCARQ